MNIRNEKKVKNKMFYIRHLDTLKTVIKGNMNNI